MTAWRTRQCGSNVRSSIAGSTFALSCSAPSSVCAWCRLEMILRRTSGTCSQPTCCRVCRQWQRTSPRRGHNVRRQVHKQLLGATTRNNAQQMRNLAPTVDRGRHDTDVKYVDISIMISQTMAYQIEAPNAATAQQRMRVCTSNG
jgi:hypothetical protein